MSPTVAEFLKVYPSLSPIDKTFNTFGGNLKIKDAYYRVRLSFPKYPQIQNFTVNITKGLKMYEIDKNKVNQEWNVSEFVENLENLLKTDNKESSISAITLTNMLQQLKVVLSDDYQVSVNDFYKKVKFENFKGYKNHFLEIENIEKDDFKIINHSLPDNTDSEQKLFKEVDNIVGYLSQFKNFLETFEEFYDNLNTIDELCYVVEPVEITTKHNWRIFKLTEKAFIKIIVDPLSPSSIALKLIGPTYEIEKYRILYNERAKNWDVDMDIYKNLLRIFELMYFPMKNDNQDTNKYCTICYTYELEDHIPIISCENQKCDLIYHIGCLKQWFITNGKTFLSVSMGTCPFCKEKLSASFSHLLEC